MKRSKKFRINIERVVKNILFLFLTIVIVSIVTSNVSAKKEFITSNITINDSETLWSIAGNISTKDKSLNIQQIIYDIEEINGLVNSDIYVGQVLKIPVY